MKILWLAVLIVLVLGARVSLTEEEPKNEAFMYCSGNAIITCTGGERYDSNSKRCNNTDKNENFFNYEDCRNNDVCKKGAATDFQAVDKKALESTEANNYTFESFSDCNNKAALRNNKLGSSGDLKCYRIKSNFQYCSTDINHIDRRIYKYKENGSDNFVEFPTDKEEDFDETHIQTLNTSCKETCRYYSYEEFLFTKVTTEHTNTVNPKKTYSLVCYCLTPYATAPTTPTPDKTATPTPDNKKPTPSDSNDDTDEDGGGSKDSSREQDEEDSGSDEVDEMAENGKTGISGIKIDCSKLKAGKDGKVGQYIVASRLQEIVGPDYIVEDCYKSN